MEQIGFGKSKTEPAMGHVNALKCENRFYVISKRQYMFVQKKTKRRKPVFLTDKPVYIDGINI